MAKVALPITFLLALLGSVACQSSYAPGPSPVSNPPRRSPLGSTSPPAYPPSPTRPAFPQPSPSPAAHPPSRSPLISTPPTYPPNPSPALYPPPSPSPLGSTPPTYPPNPSSPIYPPPSPSPLDSTPPTYPPSPSPPIYPPHSPSPLGSAPPTYPPSPSPPVSSVGPSPTAYPPSTSPTPSTNPYTSPSPSPTNSAPSMSPSASAIPPSQPPSASPPVYTSPSPSPSIVSPSPYPTPSPSPSPPSSISSPPSYPPSSISSPPSYPPSPSPSPSPSGLSVGYYRYSCPNAESIVREAVKTATASNRGTGAGLIRLFFHDCFVEGCDASVLLNTTGSTQPTERASAPNLSLRGFEVIDAAKAALEAACPGVVSCADIVAFAGRDATFFLSGDAVDYFDMPAGRYDGRVSLDSEALANLPPPFASVQVLKDMFAAKGLDTDDMVTLSGAHTVGRSHCSSFSDRLPPNASDMNATLVARLVPQCSRNDSAAAGDPTVPQDLETPDELDSQYYRNVINHEVLFGSDAALMASDQTADMVRDNAFTPGLWEAKFKAAMVKMGRAGIKTSADGEIRNKCWMVNQRSN